MNQANRRVGELQEKLQNLMMLPDSQATSPHEIAVLNNSLNEMLNDSLNDVLRRMHANGSVDRNGLI